MLALRMVAAAATIGCLIGSAQAEVSQVTVAQQFGAAFLPTMIMERDSLIEKHAAEANHPGLSVDWVQVAGPSVMNDGIISGTIHFAAQGAPSLVTLWDRTRNNVEVMGVAASTTYPLYLVTRNPNVQSIADFSSDDKIAVPSVRISTQAIMLQMAAEAEFGEGEHERLDPLTVSLSHPDAYLAMLNNTAGVNAHFASSPFYEQEMELPDAHVITTNTEILGGPATAIVISATGRFRDANPTVYRSFIAALDEAINIINEDKRAAAEFYIERTNDTRNTVDDIEAIISAEGYEFTLEPMKVIETAQFMARIGTVSQAPETLDDLFFPELREYLPAE